MKAISAEAKNNDKITVEDTLTVWTKEEDEKGLNRVKQRKAFFLGFRDSTGLDNGSGYK